MTKPKQTAFTIVIDEPVSKAFMDPVLLTLQGLLRLGFRVSLFPSGPDAFLDALEAMLEKSDLLELWEATPQNQKKVYKKADAVLCLAPPTEAYVQQIAASKCGIIAPKGTPKLERFDPIAEDGNAVLCAYDTPFHWIEGAVIARHTYGFEYDWKMMVRNLRKSVK